MNRRKSKTTVEIHQVSIIRQSVCREPAFCPVCSAPSMVTPEEAAVIANIPVRQVYRLVESGSIHYIENEDTSLFICLHSLSANEIMPTIKFVSGSGSSDC